MNISLMKSKTLYDFKVMSKKHYLSAVQHKAFKALIMEMYVMIKDSVISKKIYEKSVISNRKLRARLSEVSKENISNKEELRILKNHFPILKPELETA